MRRTLIILLVACLVSEGGNLSAQQKATAKPVPKESGRRMLVPPVYFGNSDYRGGPIQKERFAALLRQGLKSHDSLNNQYRVIGFDFSYAERKVYEDSAGNLMRVVDFTSESCFGDTLSSYMSTDADTSVDKELTLSIYQRVKPGDTIYFDHIKVVRQGRNSLLSIADTVAIAGRGIKSWIVK